MYTQEEKNDLIQAVKEMATYLTDVAIGGPSFTESFPESVASFRGKLTEVSFKAMIEGGLSELSGPDQSLASSLNETLADIEAIRSVRDSKISDINNDIETNPNTGWLS